MKRVTAQEIEAGRSEKGGWTRETLKAWGVPWPPPKGWRRKLEAGSPIGHATALSVDSDASVGPSPSVQERELRIIPEFA